jgi:ABC-2 type transport system permease protein
MKKALVIAKWEFAEKIKAKSFIIFMVLFPLILIGMGVLPSLLINDEPDSSMVVGVLDEKNLYADNAIKYLEGYKLESGQPKYIPVNLYQSGSGIEDMVKAADSRVFEKKMTGYVYIKYKDGKPELEYRSESMGAFKNLGDYEKVFNDAFTFKNLSEKGLNVEEVKSLISDVNMKTIKIQKEAGAKENDFLTTFFTSYAFIMLLMLMIMTSGGLLVRSLVEEKSNRIMEVLLSSASSDDLLTGKILGLSMLGLFQIGVWAIVAAAMLGGNFLKPEMFQNFGYMLIFFILGYMLYTAIFVGIGSSVTTEQESQQITSMISIVLIIPIIFATSIIQNPNTLLVKILSYFPLTSASIMLLRMNVQTPELWEILLVTGILILSIYLVIKISARIFRVGILSYGKRPSMKELLQWIKD